MRKGQGSGLLRFFCLRIRTVKKTNLFICLLFDYLLVFVPRLLQ
jgi:hypothetical protein